MTLTRTGWTTLRGRRRRKAELTDAEIKQAEREAQAAAEQSAEDALWDAGCDAAWQIDAIVWKLIVDMATPDEIREAYEPEPDNPYVDRSRLEFMCSVRGLDPATGKPLGA